MELATLGVTSAPARTTDNAANAFAMAQTHQINTMGALNLKSKVAPPTSQAGQTTAPASGPGRPLWPGTMTPAEPHRTKLIIGIGLVAITLLVYWRATGFDFLRYDDPDYVTANARVQTGINLPALRWALTGVRSCNWHPITWMSHMLDFQLYGLKPGGHHLTNVLLHAINVLLLFLVLRRMTGATWRGAVVAGLFAWHPLHVESVAWVSERKDMLSTMFLLLTTGAYVRYTEESAAPSAGAGGRHSQVRLYYAAALVCFALGLMSKPMVVTLPCVLLLLDFWPLCRTGLILPSTGQAPAASAPQARVLWSLVLEKLPFLAMAAASCWITIQAQENAMVPADDLPLESRLDNAVVSYVQYIIKMIWPAKLAVFYPYPDHLPLGQVAIAFLVLVAISAWVVFSARRSPWMPVGWFWYLGTLVPVIGIVQVGQQSMADRYTYIPLTGLFIAIVWGLAEAVRDRKRWKWTLGIATTGVLSSCIAVTSIQLGYWKNDISLFTHARDVTQGNFVAFAALASKKETTNPAEAIEEYNLALRYNPNSSEALFGRGRALRKQGKLEDAIADFRAALDVNPHYAAVHCSLGEILADEGKPGEAEDEYRESLKVDPDFMRAHLNLGLALFNLGRPAEATEELGAVLKLLPDDIDAQLGMGNALAISGKPDEAVAHYTRVLQLQPGNAEAHRKLGTTLAFEGKTDEAITQLRAALQSDPADASAHFQLGSLLGQRGQTVEAISHYQQSLKLRPDAPEVLNNLAWIRATSADPALRNGPEAVREALKACELTHDQQPLFLGTLAAAYAEAGDFANAISTATRARDLAKSHNLDAVADKNQELLRLYEAGQAYHEAAPSAETPAR